MLKPTQWWFWHQQPCAIFSSHYLPWDFVDTKIFVELRSPVTYWLTFSNSRPLKPFHSTSHSLKLLHYFLMFSYLDFSHFSKYSFPDSYSSFCPLNVASSQMCGWLLPWDSISVLPGTIFSRFSGLSICSFLVSFCLNWILLRVLAFSVWPLLFMYSLGESSSNTHLLTSPKPHFQTSFVPFHLDTPTYTLDLTSETKTWLFLRPQTAFLLYSLAITMTGM